MATGGNFERRRPRALTPVPPARRCPRIVGNRPWFCSLGICESTVMEHRCPPFGKVLHPSGNSSGDALR